MIKHSFFRPESGIGIYQDRQGITAVQSPLSPPWRARWHEHQALPEPLDSQKLELFFERLHRQAGRQYIPLGIGLADPWVHQVLLSFESLPRQTRERDTLVRWRLARDWQRDSEQHVISWQCLGEQNDRQWVIAQSVERSRLEPLLDYAHRHNLMLDSIDAIGNLLFNRITRPANTVFMLLQPDYWSVVVTNELGWPVHRRSKWQPLPESNEIDHFAAQLQRLLVSLTEVSPDRLILAGDVSKRNNELDTALASRLSLPVENLDMGQPGEQAEQLAIQAAGSLCD